MKYSGVYLDFFEFLAYDPFVSSLICSEFAPQRVSKPFILTLQAHRGSRKG